MSKWRPSAECIYVIPDVHGRIKLLKKICDRILPPRRTAGVKDMIIFLGDYIDGGSFSANVIDFLINLRKLYGDQIVFLKGNHEDLLMTACGLNSEPSDPAGMRSAYDIWIKGGGIKTICSYLDRGGINTNPYLVKPYRIRQNIPEKHIIFFQNELLEYFELDNFIFVHAGCDPDKPLTMQNKKTIMWDRSLCRSVISKIKKDEPIDWNKTIITGHNGKIVPDAPIVHEKFMMLDLYDDKKLLVAELNSCEAFIAKNGASRLVKSNLEETIY